MQFVRNKRIGDVADSALPDVIAAELSLPHVPSHIGLVEGIDTAQDDREVCPTQRSSETALFSTQ